MHPFSDKDIDRLSREAAEQFDVEQNTSGWEKLEQKLNKQLPQKDKRERWRFLFFICLFALLSCGGLVWVLQDDKISPVATRISPSATSLQKTAQLPPDIKPGNENQSLKTGNNITPVTTSIERRIKQNKNITILEKKGLQKNRPIEFVQADFQQNNPQLIIAGTDKQANAGNHKKTSSLKDFLATPANQIPVQDSQTINKMGDNIEQIDTPDTIPAVSSIAIQDTKQSSADSSDKAIPDKTITDTDTVAGMDTKKIAASKTKNTFKKGFEIGMVLAPDMSSVKFSSSDKVGFNYGIQLGYRLSQRWSLHTGVLYTRKNYTSAGKDFNPPAGSWLDNIKLNKVEGNCFMFDIPFNIRYDLNNGNRHRTFLSTGLSTYFMQKENYDYYYNYPNGSPGQRFKSYPSNESQWFSILNISAGFEKKLSSRLSLQAEPYLKIPLQGVGYGNIQLNSYGMYFLLKYKPVFKSAKK